MLCLLLLPAMPARGDSAEPSQEEIVERVLELQRQIEELLAALPPEVRAELRRRLAAGATPASPTAPAPETIVGAAPAAPAAPAPSAPPAADPPAGTTPPPSTVPAAETPAAATPAPPMPAPPVEAAATAPTVEAAPAAPSDGIPKLIRRRSRRAPCNTLSPLDGNGDGKISSADRYWRHLYLWTDKNDDRRLQDREVESVYDRRVREIAVSLETFLRAKGGLGEIQIEDRVVLDLRGDGFSERARRDDAVLVIDAGALARGDGPRLLGPGGEPLEGFQPFRAGLQLDLAGNLTALNCP